jgi:hypothetical protein
MVNLSQIYSLKPEASGVFSDYEISENAPARSLEQGHSSDSGAAAQPRRPCSRRSVETYDGQRVMRSVPPI